MTVYAPYCNFTLTDVDNTSCNITGYIGQWDSVTVPADLVKLSENTEVIANASYVKGSTEYYGTGTTLSLFENSVHTGDHMVVVVGDLNGDSVCDKLDATRTAQFENGHATSTNLEAYATNGSVSDTVYVASYQFVVNTALAGVIKL